MSIERLYIAKPFLKGYDIVMMSPFKFQGSDSLYFVSTGIRLEKALEEIEHF